MKQLAACVLGICLVLPVWAATTDAMPFDSPQQAQTYRDTTAVLRCPKCQDISIADSDAMIASDMRKRVYQLVREGKTKQEVVQYMVDRYGEFVNYDPPLTPSTLLLWAGPLLCLVVGGIIIGMQGRRRRSNPGLSDAEQERLRNLLKTNETGEKK